MVTPGAIVRLLQDSTSVVHFVDPTGAVTERTPASFLADARERGVAPTPGRRVAVRRSNDQGYVQALADAAVSGSIVVSVNTRFSDAEADDLIQRSGATPDAVPPAFDGIEDPFVVFTTSGTTAKPKMVLQTQESVARTAYETSAHAGYHDETVVLVAMPLCGTFGLTSFLAGLAANATVVVVEKFDVDLIGRVISDFGVQAVNGSDDMFHRLLDSGADLSSIAVGGYAGFNSSLEGIVERAHKVGATLVGLYGMSEVQAMFTVRSPQLPPAERAPAGGTMASPDSEAKVVDPETGEPVPNGVDGELLLRGPSLMAGYLAEGGHRIDRALTGSAYRDGWFATGDVAVIEDDRTFRYVTRLGDTLRIGGFLVSPAEIESVLLQLDGVHGAQVIALDRPSGARPVGFVTGEPMDESTEQAAIAHCRQHLARFKVPIAVIHVAEFPTTESANGVKIQRRVLRQLAAERLG